VFDIANTNIEPKVMNLLWLVYEVYTFFISIFTAR